MALENTFSWSKSRDEEFHDCARKYFYSRYASWGGWERGAPSEARQAYILKNIKNRWAWKGETVHHVVEHVLKSLRAGTSLPFETALRHLTETMRRDWRQSKDKKYREEPKRTLGLFEHEYEKDVPDSTWKKIHDEAAQCLGNFYGSEFYRQLLEDDKGSWLVIEDLQEFDFEGARVYVKLDFARRAQEGIQIYDWKTGKDDGSAATVQIGTYALFAMQKWSLPSAKVHAFIMNLSSPAAAPNPMAITEDLIRDTREFMRRSIEAMRSGLEDPVKNVPRPREFFKFTENLRLCQFCNFYKICEKYQK